MMGRGGNAAGRDGSHRGAAPTLRGETKPGKTGLAWPRRMRLQPGFAGLPFTLLARGLRPWAGRGKTAAEHRGGIRL